MDNSLNPGHSWVAAQMLLLVFSFVYPFARLMGLVPGWPWASLGIDGWLVAGLVLGLAGVLFQAWAVVTLGRNLTPLPKPKADAVLVVEGPYQWVRHPIYSTFLVALAGWALAWKDPVLLAADGLLFVVFWFKSRLEERWLVQRYPDYAAYQQKVGRLIPGLRF